MFTQIVTTLTSLQKPTYSWPSDPLATLPGTNLSPVSKPQSCNISQANQLTQPVFLRELEYFQGIIFLTTNLYSTIDAAFRSRVNIHLLFHLLPFSSRLVLWQKFLSRLPSTSLTTSADVHAGVSSEDLQQLAKWELNGREIKNAIKTVRTWCVCKGFEMNLLRLESGIQVTAPQARKVEDAEHDLV
jgi:hypothetical protein